jgi:hypothetical protein
MSTLRQFVGRLKLLVRGKNHIVGWNMTPGQAVSFIRGRAKMVLTFYGYSGMGYEDEEGMLKTTREVLSQYHPEKTLVLSGATEVGIGAIYPLAKSMGFETAGIVKAGEVEDPEGISSSVDHICFIKDKQNGGRLPNSDVLSPTSRAMVDCSDIMVAIGGNDISRDELLEGKQQGKPVQYFPADMNHARALHQAKRKGLPPPDSFKGTAHDTFTGLKRSDLQERLKREGRSKGK